MILLLGGLIFSRIKRDQFISLYLMPVGEGLALLIHDEVEDYSLLYDTGNRFGAMDAGRDVILPLIKNINITKLDTLILSINNQQHTGGTRTIREAFPDLDIIGPQPMQWLIPEMIPCNQYTTRPTKRIYITHLPQVQSSCAYRITLYQSVTLYLISDISPKEWEYLFQVIINAQRQNGFTNTIILYPNQGRKPFSPDIRSLPIPCKAVLFSTKTPYLDINTLPNRDCNFNSQNHELIKITNPSDQKPQGTYDHYNSDYNNHFYNGYYGTIHIQIPQPSGNKNARHQKLRIMDYRDNLRYWWLNPIIH